MEKQGGRGKVRSINNTKNFKNIVWKPTTVEPS